MILNSQAKIGTWFVGDWRSNDDSTFFSEIAAIFRSSRIQNCLYFIFFLKNTKSLFLRQNLKNETNEQVK